jgi:hypothetical protein
MKKVGVLSDTHGTLDIKIKDFFANCDEIWHAGDIGDIRIADELASLKPFRAVFGNIDGIEVRIVFSKHCRFTCEDIDVWITHIGGTPERYNPELRHELVKNPPKLFICGHSHILKVQYDTKYRFLYLNPGAAGKFGSHKYRTAIRFVIDKSEIKDLEVLELERN